MAKKKYAFLISPIAKSAYFADYLSVAKAELNFVLGIEKCKLETVGNLEFLVTSVPESNIEKALKLSFVQAIFSKSGSHLEPLDLLAEYKLHENFVYGSKYKGKTNEQLTQLLINLGLKAVDESKPSKVKLLDPMCGRGTTLMWALRYGINSKGIERDISNLAEIRQATKKWCKLHRQKHSLKEGFVNKANKQQSGKFLEFAIPQKEDNSELKANIVFGDTRDAATLLKNEKFDIIASDLPYGIQHTTQDGKRNPIETLNECAFSWSEVLKPGGVIVLAFNKYIPKREAIIDAFSVAGFKLLPFEAPHRMSESIVRDIVIFRR